jgi:signal transduction histidine kinase
LSEEQEAILRQSYESTVRLVRLVNDLLGIDRMEGGRTSFTIVPIDLHDVLKSVLADLAAEAHRRNVSIELLNKIPSGEFAAADTVQLRLVLQNVIENAVKYTRAGGSVTISLTDTGRSLSLSVKDTGIGIPADQQDQIFTQFFRARNAAKVETDGSGLGLSLSRETLLRMGGTITFISEEGAGTTFILTLPKAEKPKV